MENKITFNLSKDLYSKIILFRTCYTLIDNYYVYIDDDSNQWTVSLMTKDFSPISDIKKVEGEFRNTLINESFRDLLIDKTKNVKEMIVARALYGSDENDINVQSDFSHIEENMDEYLDDPDGIAIPWEEKHGKDPKNN